MLHELLIYSIKTCYGCITIYLSISDSPSLLPWGFSHIQSQPLWHTLLSLFKYPVTSPSGPDTQRHVIKGSISLLPRLPSCVHGDRLIFWLKSTVRNVQLKRSYNFAGFLKVDIFASVLGNKKNNLYILDLIFVALEQ